MRDGGESERNTLSNHPGQARGAERRSGTTAELIAPSSHHTRPHRAPNVVLPNSAFCVEGCERQYCGGASTIPPSSAAACQPQRGS
ncbi:hypothetical protein AB7M16_004289 [Bradyrhizobium sp. USDA 372]